MITLEDIIIAHKRIKPFIHRTPILTSDSINRLTGSNLFFKCENFQKAGAFKIRGATNAVEQLTAKQMQSGIVTASSGNHGAALALAASRHNKQAVVIMPNNSSKMKIANVKRNGGDIIWCEPIQKSREMELEKYVSNSGAEVIHPYNDKRVISGQGTAAKELLEDCSNLDSIVCPVSGGGLLSGTLCAAKNMKHSITIYGAEPIEADDTYRSLRAGKRLENKTTNTICDGLRAQVGVINFSIINAMVDDIITLSEEEIISSMRIIFERMKILVEPSSAIALAAIIKRKDLFENKDVGIILSGGNIDIDAFPW